MPLRLSEKYLRQIAALASTVPIERWWAALDTEAYRTLARSVADIHKAHMTEHDVGYVLIGAVVECIAGVGQARTGLLTDAPNADLRDKFCDFLRARIESLPWAIQVNFPLPQFINFDGFTLRISDSISLRTEWAPPSSKEQMHGLLALAVPKNHAWLCIDVKGFIAPELETSALSIAISQAKQCLYFFSLFSWARPHHMQGQVVTATAILPQLQHGIRLPPSLARYLGTLTSHDDALQVFEPKAGKSILGGEFRQAVTPGERASALQGKLRVAQQFFLRRGNADFDAIAAAIEWYMDSITSDNQTFAYIAACIGLEALLGLGDASERMDAMSSRLCDRYGFLLGAGRNERERLSLEYRDILNLRGKLVHARSKRLTAGEREKLSQVQRMLAKVIDREIEVFNKD